MHFPALARKFFVIPRVLYNLFVTHNSEKQIHADDEGGTTRNGKRRMEQFLVFRWTLIPGDECFMSSSNIRTPADWFMQLNYCLP